MAILNCDLRFLAGSEPSTCLLAITLAKVSKMLTVLSVASDEPPTFIVPREPVDTSRFSWSEEIGNC